MKKSKYILSLLIIISISVVAVLLFIGCDEKLNPDYESYLSGTLAHAKKNEDGILTQSEVHQYNRKGICKVCGWHKEYTENFEFRNYGDGPIVVINSKKESVEIPENLKCWDTIIDTVMVTSSSVKTVKLNSNIKNIGDCSECASLEKFTNCPDALYIDSLSDCTNFIGFDKDVILDFEYNAFENTKLSGNVVLSNTMTKVPAAAFKNTNITSLTLGPNLSTIDRWAFMGCKNLKTVNLNVTDAIGESAFDGCESLEVVNIQNIEDKSISLGQSAFYKCTSLKKLNIPNDIEYMDVSRSCFSGCVSLEFETLNIPSGSFIDDYAFMGCKNIKNLKIGENTNIGDSAFYRSGIENIEIETYGKKYNDGTIFNFDKGAFSGLKEMKSFKFCNTLYVDTIEESTFEFSGLESIDIPEGIKVLGESAFDGCKLNYVVLPKSLKKISNFCFSDHYNVDYQYPWLTVSKDLDVYYKGTKEDWNKIEIGTATSSISADSTTLYPEDTPYLEDGRFTFYFHNFNVMYYSEIKPTDTTNEYWHYVDGLATKWSSQ